MATQHTIGVIGLGNMGGMIARRMLECNQNLIVYDLRPNAIQALTARGATGVNSARELAERSEVILTVLPNGPHVEAAASGSEGLLAGVKANSIWVEMSTIDPNITRNLAAKAAEKDVTLLDAGIGGLPERALSGELLLMVGGADADVNRAKPVFDLLGEFVHCGSTGAGVSMKLVNNQLAGVIFAATCEGLLMGRKAGLTFDAMQKVFSKTGANSNYLHGTLPKRLVTRNFDPVFSLNLMVKDAGLALDFAADLHAPAVLGAVVQQLRMLGINQGLGEEDVIVFIKVLEAMAGIQLSDD